MTIFYVEPQMNMESRTYIRQQLKILGWIVIGWLLYSLYIQVVNHLYLGHFKNYIDFTNESIGFDPNTELITSAVFSVFGALFFGSMELFVLKKFFQSYPIGKKLLLKGIIHALIIIMLIVGGSMFYNSLRYQSTPFDPTVLKGVKGFVTSTGFTGNFMFIYFGLMLTLVFLTINEQLGPGRLKDLILGRYNRAIKENRIFMFLDLRSSTVIAEQLGHEKYFQLLNQFFADITDPILEFNGKIYQYVGDEIVVTWRLREPERNLRCLQTFYRMQQLIRDKSQKYIDHFGLVPEFKAGMHCGEVTTGEIGLIKKDIIHTGDVLNTTARIEKKCNDFNQNLVLSDDLHARLPLNGKFTFSQLGSYELRGKEKKKSLYGVSFN